MDLLPRQVFLDFLRLRRAGGGGGGTGGSTCSFWYAQLYNLAIQLLSIITIYGGISSQKYYFLLFAAEGRLGQ